jgi:diaminopimelate decarboxylase
MAKIDRFLSVNHLPTPFVVIDLDLIRSSYSALQAFFQMLPSSMPSRPIRRALRASYD